MDRLKVQKFSEINLDDQFFDSLKESYTEFSHWFKSKADKEALVLYDEKGNIEGFLYHKFEQGLDTATAPPLPNTSHMKVGTFKFNPQGTRRGDRYIKKIFDYALNSKKKVDDIYVTIFEDKHQYLVDLFERYGFERYAEKPSSNGNELVLLKDLHKRFNHIEKDYPFINATAHNKYLLSIRPDFHTRLFPDSKLLTEPDDIVQDVSHSNSINKVYLCKMRNVLNMRPGDVVVIYRMGDGRGAAEYRAVATSLCVVESVGNIYSNYSSEKEFIDDCLKYSVFSEKELRDIYRDNTYPFIIKFTYNVALPKRPIRRSLANDAGLNRDDYWGVLKLSDQQFQQIIELSELDPALIR